MLWTRKSYIGSRGEILFRVRLVNPFTFLVYPDRQLTILITQETRFIRHTNISVRVY